MKIALAQIDTTAGDVEGNGKRIRDAWGRARRDGADLVVVPELAVVGYPPRDLLLREGVVRAAERTTAALAAEFADGPPAVLGTVTRNPAPTGRGLHNAAAFCRGGRVEAVYAKRLLPTYDVFDEGRYFAPGDRAVVVTVAGRRLGLSVCEDLWVADLVGGRRLYDVDPAADLARAGAQAILNVAASPYHSGKDDRRRALFAGEARRTGLPVVCVSLVGGNDEVLFDGRSRAFDPVGRETVTLAAYEEDYALVDPFAATPVPPAPPLSDAEDLRRALVMGLRAYARKCRLPTALVGLSGGVDSAVVACLAADALGARNVLGVAMPGPFSAPESERDAKALAQSLGIGFATIPIVPIYEAYLAALAPTFQDRPFDATEENVQARVRGALLMALSNKFGRLVLATGNKSELAVGYCTLYGDMCGGLAVISDVWKTRVYDLARLYARDGRGPIPQNTITRPPSAELRPNQKDTDSLPPYDVLDRILRRRIEDGLGAKEIAAAGDDPAVVERVLLMLDRAEYKRRQMAPGLKVSPVAFGVGRRMPIARPVDLSSE